MEPIAKHNKAGFELYLQKKLPLGSDNAKYAGGLDQKIKAFYKKHSQNNIGSIYDIQDEEGIYNIKKYIVSHPSLVYRRGHSGDSRLEGLDLYLDYLRTRKASHSTTVSQQRDLKLSTLETEGKHIKQETTVIQRNPQARQKCIEHFGCRCAACGLSMADKYGVLGEGVIEVHHLNPIHLFDDTHPVDYLTDLIPLCPNCHTMIHKLADPGDIEGLRNMITDLISDK